MYTNTSVYWIFWHNRSELAQKAIWKKDPQQFRCAHFLKQLLSDKIDAMRFCCKNGSDQHFTGPFFWRKLYDYDSLTPWATNWLRFFQRKIRFKVLISLVEDSFSKFSDYMPANSKQMNQVKDRCFVLLVFCITNISWVSPTTLNKVLRVMIQIVIYPSLSVRRLKIAFWSFKKNLFSFYCLVTLN